MFSDLIAVVFGALVLSYHFNKQDGIDHDEFAVSEKVAFKLAALQSQVVLGPYVEGKEHRYEDTDQYLCRRILNSSRKNWSKEIAHAHKNYGCGKTELESKVFYLSCVKQLSLYGSAMFPACYRGTWSHGSDVILAVNSEGVKFLKSKDKSIIQDYKYADIESMSVDSIENFVTFELKTNTEGQQKSYMFESRSKEDIVALVSSYAPSLSGWKRQGPDVFPKQGRQGKRVSKSYFAFLIGGRRPMKLTDDDKLKLYDDILSFRRTLIESGILQKPPAEGSGFFRNTIRRLSRPKIERFRDGDDCEFKVSYWSYQKSPLRQSLSSFRDSDLEEIAVKMFNSTLIYAGLDNSTNLQGDDHLGVIQVLLNKCLESEDICNEFYLQLIKQTTDHPDPNSRVNVRNWQLLAMACAVIVPTNQTILHYLQSHLRKCAIERITEEGKFAVFCQKCLNKTLEKQNRKFPPSYREISFIIQRKYVHEKIHFLDGQHRMLEFDSTCTAEEVIQMVKSKIGMMSDAKGWALYEVCGQLERNMLLDDSLVDAMYKWERWSRSSKSNKDLKFTFRKRIFIEPFVNPADQVEVDLIHHQSVIDVFEEKVPLSTQDAVHLCALRAQSEFGDTQTAGKIDYSTVTRILPRSLRDSVHDNDIMAMHGALKGMDATQAHLASMDVLRNWPLYGAMVYEVTQSHVSSLPKDLWLFVNKTGIHMMAVKGKEVLQFYNYSEIVSYSPSMKSLLVIIGNVAKGTKFIFMTNQASQIAHLMKDYINEMNRAKTKNNLLSVPGAVRDRSASMDSNNRSMTPPKDRFGSRNSLNLTLNHSRSPSPTRKQLLDPYALSVNAISHA
ncbi:pleckstrin homology domain-containing family H member 2-like [Tubulanus polymorphus]|uniref:pleckstrin homology domain-containing family H member 2-like n=1 Tax=Tubulanus polymorphus TaxID=672921 RepID=UPI003DA28E3B